MCSVGEDVFETHSDKVMLKPEKRISSICNKCRTTNACIILRYKDAYCQNCFLASTTHKFKAILGKSKLVHPSDKVLIYYKTGHPSTALLHFLRTGFNLNSPKKFKFELIVLFIEDQCHLKIEERRNILRKVKEEVMSSNFKLYCISFVKYISNIRNDCDIIDDTNQVTISENDQEAMWSILDKKISESNRSEVLNLIKRQLVIDVARKLNCNLVFTPEISVDTASTLLTNISLGRGSHVAFDTGFCDNRDDIKILRPLRLFDMKELAFYNRLNNLEPVVFKQHNINNNLSVQDLMMKFVKDLQVNYPATVTTVLRTGDKLSSVGNKNNVCILCKGMLAEKNLLELTSQDSIKFSHLVSTVTPDYTISREERYQNVLNKFDNRINTNDYCYACSKIAPYIKV